MLWAGVAPGAWTYSFPEAARRKLIRAIKEAPPRGAPPGADDEHGLWPHQQEAIAKFMDKRHDSLEMATGSSQEASISSWCGSSHVWIRTLGGGLELRVEFSFEAAEERFQGARPVIKPFSQRFEAAMSITVELKHSFGAQPARRAVVD